MTYLIQIQFDWHEPVKYLSEFGEFVSIESAKVYTNKDNADTTAFYLAVNRPELIIKVIPQSEL